MPARQPTISSTPHSRRISSPETGVIVIIHTQRATHFVDSLREASDGVSRAIGKAKLGKGENTEIKGTDDGIIV